MSRSSINPRVVAIHAYGEADNVVGTGVQLDATHVLTCAHVVGQVFGNKDCYHYTLQDVNQDPVWVTPGRFARNKKMYQAKVVEWYPPMLDGDGHQLADIALLELTQAYPKALPANPYLSCEHLKAKDACLAVGFPGPEGEGDKIFAKYAEETTNWHLLKAEHGDQFLGGFSGGPVVKLCPSSGEHYFIGLTVAQGRKDNRGQMIALSVLLAEPSTLVAEKIKNNFYIKETTQQETLVAETILPTSIPFPLDTIKERCLYFFNRQSLIDKVNKKLAKRSLVLLSVKGLEEDGFDKFAQRIFYEAPPERIHQPRQVWNLSLDSFSGVDSVASTLKTQALEAYFAGCPVERAEGAPVHTWQDVVCAFAEQFFIDEQGQPLPSRFVFHCKLPPSKLCKEQFAIVTRLLEEFRDFKRQRNGQDTQVLLVFSMECHRANGSVFSKFAQRMTSKLYYEAFCDKLAVPAKSQGFAFLPALLEKITEDNLGDWGRCFQQHFQLTDAALYQPLCEVADSYVEQKQAVHYQELFAHVEFSTAYENFLKT